jgi:hypothetical protein
VLLESPGQGEGRQLQKEATFKGEGVGVGVGGEVELLRASIEQLQEEKDNLFQHLEGEKSKSQHWQNIYR